jgi:hypothetical protein
MAPKSSPKAPPAAAAVIGRPVYVTTFHLDGEMRGNGLTFSDEDEANAYAMLVDRVTGYFCKVTETTLDGDWRDNLKSLAADTAYDQPLNLPPSLLRDLTAALEVKRNARDPIQDLLDTAVLAPPPLTW